jgi:signal transduction histidine kinase
VIRRTSDGVRVDWHCDVPDGICAAIDRDDLAEALGALVENAARHAGSEVRISARCDDGQVSLSVRDDGPSIPPEQIEMVIERGARADLSGPGTGLGLAIAADIAMTAGGGLSLHPLESGLDAQLVLPGGSP